MAKGKTIESQKHFTDPQEIERVLIERIADTGKQQLKKRRKAGLSSFYAKDGKIVELLPNNSEHQGASINSKWVSLNKEKRSLKLK